LIKNKSGKKELTKKIPAFKRDKGASIPARADIQPLLPTMSSRRKKEG
jgi:hypothetical protein